MEKQKKEFECQKKKKNELEAVKSKKKNKWSIISGTQKIEHLYLPESC